MGGLRKTEGRLTLVFLVDVQQWGFDCSFEGEGFPMGLHRLFAVSEKAAEPTAVSVNVFAVMLGALLVTLVASQLIRLALAHSSYRRSYWRCRPGYSRSFNNQKRRAAYELRGTLVVATVTITLICLLSGESTEQTKLISNLQFSIPTLWGESDSTDESDSNGDFQERICHVKFPPDGAYGVDDKSGTYTIDREKSPTVLENASRETSEDKIVFMPYVNGPEAAESSSTSNDVQAEAARPLSANTSPESAQVFQSVRPGQPLTNKAQNLATSYPNNKRIFAPMNARDIDADFLNGRSVDNVSVLLDKFTSKKNAVVPVSGEFMSDNNAGKGALIDNSVPIVSNERKSEDNLIVQLNEEMHKITETIQKSVLSIGSPKALAKDSTAVQEETGSGFLFAYDSNVYAMTNEHVIRGRGTDEAINIHLPNNQLIHPTEVYCSVELDVAVLKLNPRDLPKDGSVVPVSFEDSDMLRVSNIVFAFGSPFGLTRTMSYGHISALGRSISDVNVSSANSSNINALSEYVQLDAFINPGNSGGPLFDARGRVVGMVTQIATKTGLNEGVAFAIPSNVLLRVAKSLIDHKGDWRRSRLGVELTSATRADLAATNINEVCGAKIVRVVANSPAKNAGLRAGDLILTYNGATVLNDAQLNRMIALTDSSEKASLGILRGNQFFELESSVLRSRQ